MPIDHKLHLNPLKWLNKGFAATTLALGAWFFGSPLVEASQAVIKLPAEQSKHVFGPKRLTLIVGINRFKHAGWQPLRYPHKDASDMQRFLQTHPQSPQDHTQVLLESEATLENITAALDQLEARNTSPDDTVLVYLSTHGSLHPSTSTGAWQRFAALYDSDPKLVQKRGLRIGYLEERLSRLRSRKKALILALCHSGAGKSSLPAFVQKQLSQLKSQSVLPPLHQVSRAMMVLSASRFGETAREDDRLENDIYTYFLLKGLDGADANRDGAVSLFEAHEYARNRTYDYTQGQQTPSAMMSLEGSDPILLKGKVTKQGAPLLFADHDGFRRLEVLVNGQSKGRLWKPLALPSGAVKLTLIDPEHASNPVTEHMAYLKPGTSYSVTDMIRRAPQVRTAVTVSVPTLPLKLIQSAGKPVWLPRLHLNLKHAWGLPIDAGLELGHLRQVSQLSLERIQSAQTWTMTEVFAWVGATRGGDAFGLSDNLEAWTRLGVHSVWLERRLASEQFQQPQQSQSLATIRSDIGVSWTPYWPSFHLHFGISGLWPVQLQLSTLADDGRLASQSFQTSAFLWQAGLGVSF